MLSSDICLPNNSSVYNESLTRTHTLKMLPSNSYEK
jgi:hypothetical protein